MTHARLTHPDRPTLEFRQPQQDTDNQESETNIMTDLGSDSKPLVHITTKQRSRSIRGTVTGPRRAANDPNTSDWRQALANYVDVLESHVDEFQGFHPESGYTFEDDVKSESLNAVYHGLSWTLSKGSPYEVEFEADVTIGRGTFESDRVRRRNPTVQSGMSVAARVGGVELPGLRRMEVSREFPVETKAVYDKDSAENNDVAASEGVQQQVVFEGTHSGSRSARRSADAALAGLQDGSQYSFETAFPGYSLDGFVVGYETAFEARFGKQRHDYTLRFVEGEPA